MTGERLHVIRIPKGAYAARRRLSELQLERYDVQIAAVRRNGIRGSDPTPDTLVRSGDVLVLRGKPKGLVRAERRILAGQRWD